MYMYISLVPRPETFSVTRRLSCNRTGAGPGNVQYLDLNRWDGVRLGLGPG